jgi:phospholipid/cholesterol/gamma-HCH transport system permease protein
VAAHLYTVLATALPLALLTGLALGAVIWMHTRGVLLRTGGAELLPTVLAVAVVLELGPIAAGLILAARSGAGLAAELAAMRLTEQVNALQLLGASPWRELIGPRVMACVIAAPLLDAFISCMALLGGYAGEAAAGSMSWLYFRTASLDQLRLHEAVPATLKTLVFGFLVGARACQAGLSADGGSLGVGEAASRGVVGSVMLVLIADVLLVGLTRMLLG